MSADTGFNNRRPLAEVVAFLLGECPLDGVWFGEQHPTERSPFWWRKHLRAAAGAAPSQGQSGHACTEMLSGNAALDVLRAAMNDAGDLSSRGRADLIGFFCNRWNEALFARAAASRGEQPTVKASDGAGMKE